jgi:inner membrane protein
MLTPTHLITAQTAYLGACVAAAHPPAVPEGLVALGAALIPDLDSRQSYPGRVLPPLSEWLERRFGHRSLTHSLLAQALAGLVAWWLLPPGFLLALLAGWVSHTLADMMTPAGVAWFWPARARCVPPGNPRYRMEVMGGGELAFLVVMAVAGLVLMPLARTGEGTTGLIRSAIGDITAARGEYDAAKGSCAFTLEIRGRDNRSDRDIAGTYPVAGPWQESGFILESAEGPRSACRSATCDWYADHADLKRGAAIETSTFPLTAQTTTGEALQAALAPLAGHGTLYLLGTFEAPGSRATPPTVEVAGERVTLHYVSPETLAAWRGRALRDLDLAVQVRHAPGKAPPPPSALAGRGPAVHPLLNRWLR